MNYSLGNTLSRGGSLNADGLSLDLQFAADKTLTARKGPTPTFTRASAATEVGSDGLIRYAPENLALQSENFGTTWINNTGNALALNDALSPTGTLTADRIDFPATAATGLIKNIQQNFGSLYAGSGPVTASVWLRTVSGTSTVYLTLLDGAPFQRFHVACNVTTTWTRFSVTLNVPASGLFILIGPDTRTTVGTPAQPAVQDAASVYAWGAQLERHTSARDYIPTTTAAVFGARFDHDPVTLTSKGLLIEESRTNLVFPSATLTTQTRTVTAVAHTLSFYGTGTVVLSGVAIATVTGTGAYPTRTTLTFTPTAGSLILTVTGSVTEAQLEAGSFPTSYIPTTTASVVRSADVCSITGSDFTGFYNQSEGTIVGSGLTNQPTTNASPELFRSSDGTNNNRIQIGMTNVAGQAIRPFIVSLGTTTYSNNQGTASVGVERKIGTAYKTNDTISAFNGTLGTLDTTVTLPTNCNAATLFSGFGSGTISSLRYFKKRISNAKLQTLTT